MRGPTGPRAITIRQPWASAVFAARGGKNVENRTWRTDHRGLLYIHAAQRPDRSAPAWVWRLAGRGLTDPDFLPNSALIGHVNVTDCVWGYEGRWAEFGMWNWIMKDRILFAAPIPCTGTLSLWPVPQYLWASLDKETA